MERNRKFIIMTGRRGASEFRNAIVTQMLEEYKQELLNSMENTHKNKPSQSKLNSIIKLFRATI